MISWRDKEAYGLDPALIIITSIYRRKKKGNLSIHDSL